MGKIVAVDYGERRIGLAIGELITSVAMPWRVLEGSGRAVEDAERVAAALRDSGETVDRIVVGLPLNMDDSEGAQAKRARAFGRALGELAEVVVDFWDERLSSFTAEQRYASREKSQRAKGKRSSRSKRSIDAVAAAVILEGYLAGRKHESSSE